MTSNTPCLEVAISTTKEPATFEELQRQAHLDLETFPGFINDVKLRALEHKTTHADLILWESEVAARSAAERIEHDERFSSFMESIASVTHFAHYNGASLEAINRLAESSIVEIAAYRTSSASNSTALRAKLYEALRAIEGVSPEAAGTNIDDASILLDLFGWENRTLHDNASDVLLKQHPALKPFFSSLEKIEVRALFEVLR